MILFGVNLRKNPLTTMLDFILSWLFAGMLIVRRVHDFWRDTSLVSLLPPAPAILQLPPAPPPPIAPHPLPPDFPHLPQVPQHHPICTFPSDCGAPTVLCSALASSTDGRFNEATEASMMEGTRAPVCVGTPGCQLPSRLYAKGQWEGLPTFSAHQVVPHQLATSPESNMDLYEAGTAAAGMAVVIVMCVTYLWKRFMKFVKDEMLDVDTVPVAHNGFRSFDHHLNWRDREDDMIRPYGRICATNVNDIVADVIYEDHFLAEASPARFPYKYLPPHILKPSIEDLPPCTTEQGVVVHHVNMGDDTVTFSDAGLAAAGMVMAVAMCVVYLWRMFKDAKRYAMARVDRVAVANVHAPDHHYHLNEFEGGDDGDDGDDDLSTIVRALVTDLRYEYHCARHHVNVHGPDQCLRRAAVPPPFFQHLATCTTANLIQRMSSTLDTSGEDISNAGLDPSMVMVLAKCLVFVWRTFKRFTMHGTMR